MQPTSRSESPCPLRSGLNGQPRVRPIVGVTNSVERITIPMKNNPPSLPQNTLQNRAAAFHQKEDAAAKKKTGKTNQNPYARAYEEVLAGLPEWKRKEVISLEKTNRESPYYLDFVSQVAILGDKYSS